MAGPGCAVAPASQPDDAVGARVVAAILDLDHGPGARAGGRLAPPILPSHGPAFRPSALSAGFRQPARRRVALLSFGGDSSA